MKLNTRVWPATSKDTNDPGTLKLTISKFYRVTGASTQLKGVESDIVLPDVLNYSTDIGESALENALPCDTNAPVNFTRINLVQPYLVELRRRSETRTATNQDFSFIHQDIDEFKKLQAEKTATLNEQEALKERKQTASQKAARDKQLTRQGAPNEKIFELTLKNAGDTGLPQPIAQTNSPANISEGRLNDDARLKETERILEDYISLLSKNVGSITNP